MKKHLLLTCAFLSLFFSATKATTHIISVASFSFTPSSLTVNTGDTITWVWQNGSHTTTSTAVPTGAATWNSPMTSNVTTFSYVPTVAGTYNYVCTPHSSSMQGSFTVVSGVGINETTLNIANFNAYVSQRNLTLSFNVRKSGNMVISIIDLTGKEVMQVVNSTINAGDYKEVYSLEQLPVGVYLVRLESEGDQKVKRIIVQ